MDEQWVQVLGSRSMHAVLAASVPTDALVGIATCAVGFVLAIVPVHDDAAATGTLIAFGALEAAGIGLGIADSHRALGVIDISTGGSLISAAGGNLLRYAISSAGAARLAKQVAERQALRGREIVEAGSVRVSRDGRNGVGSRTSPSPGVGPITHECHRALIRGTSVRWDSSNERVRDRKLLRYLRYEVTITPVPGGLEVQGWAQSACVRALELFRGEGFVDQRLEISCDPTPNGCTIGSGIDGDNDSNGPLTFKVDISVTQPSDDRLQADVSVLIAFNSSGVGDVGGFGFQIPLPRSSSFQRDKQFPPCVWVCDHAQA
jgi:hypothetical protein